LAGAFSASGAGTKEALLSIGIPGRANGADPESRSATSVSGFRLRSP
jgi:hypothetical protein